MAVDVVPPTAGERENTRVSRYRSVRKSQQERQPTRDQQPPPAMPAMTMATIKDSSNVGRTASRYRRAAKPLTQHEPLPQMPSATGPAAVTAQSSFMSGRQKPVVQQDSPPLRRPRRDSFTAQVKGPEPEQHRGQTLGMPEPGRAEQEAGQQRRVAEQDAEHQRRVEERDAEEQRRAAEREALEQTVADKRTVPKIARREAQKSRDSEEAQRRHNRQDSLARLEGERIEGRRPSHDHITRLHKDDKRRSADVKPTEKTAVHKQLPSSTEKWTLFKKRRAEDVPRSPPSTVDPRPKTSHASSGEAPSHPSLVNPRMSADAASGEIPTIKPGGGGVVPGIDAPISAVNADGRRVMVEFNKSQMRFPIDPETTPLQLIRSASNCMSEKFDPRASILLEVYSKANVQRPLRMYEHVRDVMNSWDNDDQHSLIVVPITPDGNKELYSAWAPKTQPEGASWTMYYSNKPGKWDKRFITLKPEGQLVYDKSNGKDTVAICRLSDFDVYAVMPKRLKKVNPKRKHCYAIKSQQKSNMFMDMSSFFHLFATSEQHTAEHFYRTVQAWRSWYLSEVMGEGRKAQGEQKTTEGAGAGRTSVDEKVHMSKSTPHLRTASVDSHYVLGTFNTLDLDASKFTYGGERRGHAAGRPSISELRDNEPLALAFPTAADHSKQMHERKLSGRKHTAPPISYPKGLRPPQNSSFSSDGLLGKEYSDRQRAMQQSDGAPGPRSLGMPPPASSSSGGLRRSSSVRSSRSATSIDGGRPKPKPLVDLTPQFKEAPQFNKKGRGFRPDRIPAGGLIDAVAAPDDPIAAPSSRDWKRPGNNIGQGRTQGQGPRLPSAQPLQGYAYDCAKGLRGHGVKMEVAMPGPGAAAEGDAAFTGGGLLGQGLAKQAWGAGDRGHGHTRGVAAKGPLVDLREGSEFAEGSLLRNIER